MGASEGRPPHQPGRSGAAREGDELIIDGLATVITADPTTNTGLAVKAWPGSTVSGASYYIRFTSDGVRQGELARRYLELAGQIANTGIGIDAFGELADRDAYDAKPTGWAFLSLDGDGDTLDSAVIFLKNSSTSGDWSDAVPIEGAEGPSGLIGVWEGAWQTATVYAVNDAVFQGGSSYICLVAHTSGTFSTDLAASKWELVAQKGDTGATGATGAAGTNGTNGTNGADGADGTDGIMASVVAGTNVSVDATDPANPIVSALPAFTPASSSGPAQLDLAEDTDNGTNKVTLQAPASMASDRVVTLPDATDTLVGRATTDTLTNKTLTSPTMVGTPTEDIFTITDGAGFEIDPANGSIQQITLGASRTPAATSFANGQGVLLMVNDGTAYTITWTTIGVVWIGGSAPTLATTGWTHIVLWKVGGTVYGKSVGTSA